MSIGAQRALFALGGLLAGGLLVLATLKITSPQREPVSYSTPPAQSRLGAEPSTPEAGASKPGGVPDDPANAKKDDRPPTGTPPFDPFDQSITVPMPGSEISGHISAGPPPEVPAHSSPEPTPSPVPPATAEEPAVPKGYLVTMRLDVENPESAVQAIQGVASKLGGSAFQFDETASRLDPEGAIILVPAAKAEEAQKQLGNVGSIVVRDTWSGSAGARLDRIENEAQNRLSDLRMKRQELLVKYFEDAPQIQHIDEDMERINKGLASLRAKKPGPDTAVLKIKFLS